MNVIENIYPYSIVEENGFYGITDNSGNLVVPCVMDEITNVEDEDIGEELWRDYYCVLIIKDGMYGFFTKNGKFIDPAYEGYAIDPCGGDIHVKAEDGYGVFAAPEYAFKELNAENSFLAEITEDDDEDDMLDLLFDTDDMDDEESSSWSDMGINEDIIPTINKRLHSLGYKYTQELWDSTYDDNKPVNIEEFITSALSKFNDWKIIKENLGDIKAQGECNETDFWDIVEEKDNNAIWAWCANMAKRGAVSFISLKGMDYANIPMLNSKIREHLKDEENNGYYSIFRLIERLLPCPEHRSFETIPVVFPAGERPLCAYSDLCDTGEIGEIYLYEHGMHTYNVCVNVYDQIDPEKLLDENHILEVSDILLSDLLTSLQQAIDPAKENANLSAAIDKAIDIENGESNIAQILKDCGIYLLSLSDFGRTPRFYDGYISADVDYIYVLDDEVTLVLEGETNTVSLNSTDSHYSWIVDDIKAAANMAYKEAKKLKPTI